MGLKANLENKLYELIKNELSDLVNLSNANFKNNYVMELGCGPHLGFGPMAIYLGAKKFLAVDNTVN